MKEKQLSELLDRHISSYLDCIAVELEKPHDTWFDGFGFPMFGETSKQYHEQVYFQSYLESYTRQLVNGILKEIADEESDDEIVWPEQNHFGIYRGYTNSECEQKFGFEFINRETNVGYRYCYFRSDEIESLMALGNVDGITLVLWENNDAIIGSDYGDERVKILLLCDLFHEFFYDLDEEEVDGMYGLFIERVANAVERANSMISLTTVPGFTPSYLYKTRNETVTNMRKEIRGLSCFSVNNVDFKQNEVESKKLVDTYKLPQVFLTKGYENAFVGTSDYAKSFLTSEYLYRYFQGNPMFDYTPIVSGYLKSIEQLLHAIYTSYLNGNGIQIDVSNYTLGHYINALKNEKVFRKTFRKELLQAKWILIGCLNSYRAESRNNLFHKDYFSSWERVEQIRSNTLFLYVALLGAVKPVIVSDPTVLGILSIEYDHLFCALDEQKDLTYTMVLNGKEYLNLSKAPRRKGLVFDKDGLIMNTVQFTWLGYDEYESIEISRANMPSEIWITDRFGKKKSRVWPLA